MAQEPPRQPEHPELELPEAELPGDLPDPPIPKEEGSRSTLRPPQEGQLTRAEARGTILSKAFRQLRQRYS